MPRKKITVNHPQKEKFIPQEEEFVPQEEESLQLLGQKIREARIAKNLSLESVSGHLHIAVKILEAIEEGNPDKGPSPVFLRGLVRTYCQFLEIDKTEIADKIDQVLKSVDQDEQQIRTFKPVLEIRESNPIRNIVTGLVLVSGGYLLYSLYFSQMPFFLSNDNNTLAKSVVVEVDKKAIESEKIIVADEKMIETFHAKLQTKEEPVEVTETIPEKIETTEKIIATEDSIPEKTETTVELAAAEDSIPDNSETTKQLAVTEDSIPEKAEIKEGNSSADQKQKEITELVQAEVEQDLIEPLTLEVEASEGTWISVSVDGNDAEDIRLATEEIHQWEAKTEYQVTLGNTHAVRILLNGREIETDRTHQLLMDWVIDKSFLP